MEYITHSKGPVNAQVKGDQNDVIQEEVYSLSPPPYCSMSTTMQLGKEEGTERVDLPAPYFLLTAGHHEIHVEVDHLRVTEFLFD